MMTPRAATPDDFAFIRGLAGHPDYAPFITDEDETALAAYLTDPGLRGASFEQTKAMFPQILAQLGATPRGVRWSRRVHSSPSSRVICWLSADCTMSRSAAARLMEPSSTMRTK